MDNIFVMLTESKIPSKSMTFFEGEKEKTISLFNKFMNIRKEDNEIWGKLRYEIEHISEDIEGNIYPTKSVMIIEFVILDGATQFLVGFRGGKQSTYLARLLNEMINPKVPIIRKVRLSGEMIKQFMKQNPYTPKWTLMPVPIPGWTKIGISGSNVEKPLLYKELEDHAGDIERVTLELHEYKWVICISKNGSILDFSMIQKNSFIDFIRKKILPFLMN